MDLTTFGLTVVVIDLLLTIMWVAYAYRKGLI